MCYIIQVSLISRKDMWAKGLNLFQRLKDQENENEDLYFKISRAIYKQEDLSLLKKRKWTYTYELFQNSNAPVTENPILTNNQEGASFSLNWHIQEIAKF